VAEKRVCWQAFHERRSLIPADGCYEGRGRDSKDAGGRDLTVQSKTVELIR